MSITESTAIDNKKKENETGTIESPNYGSFASQLISYVITTLVIFGVIGSVGLYTCKIAQANVLPTDMDYYPFGDEIKEVDQIHINTNVVKEYGYGGFGWLFGENPVQFSTKIEFDFNNISKNYDNGLIGMMNKWKNDPKKANFFGFYIRDVIFNIIAANNSLIDKIYNTFNENISESMILLLYPMFFFIFSILMVFVNMALTFFYQIKCAKDFFMGKNEKGNKVEWFEPFTYFQPFRLICLGLYAFFLFFPIVFLLPILIVIYTIFSPLFISGNIQNTKTPFGFAHFLRDVLLYKSQLFIIIMTYGLLTISQKTLGTNALIGCIIGILIVFFSFHLYNQYIPKNDSNLTPGLASTKPAKTNIEGTMSGGKRKINKHKNKKIV
jgi:hypothetical protein